MRTITVYTQPGCMPCALTRRALAEAGLAHQALDAQTGLDPELLDLAIRKHGAARTAPLVVVWGADGGVVACWSGFRPDLVAKLAESGSSLGDGEAA